MLRGPHPPLFFCLHSRVNRDDGRQTLKCGYAPANYVTKNENQGVMSVPLMALSLREGNDVPTVLTALVGRMRQIGGGSVYLTVYATVASIVEPGRCHVT